MEFFIPVFAAFFLFLIFFLVIKGGVSGGMKRFYKKDLDLMIRSIMSKTDENNKKLREINTIQAEINDILNKKQAGSPPEPLNTTQSSDGVFPH